MLFLKFQFINIVILAFMRYDDVTHGTTGMEGSSLVFFRGITFIVLNSF